VIALERIDDGQGDHFVIRATEPMRVEVVVRDAQVLVHAYDGYPDKPDAEPVGGYDSAYPIKLWLWVDPEELRREWGYAVANRDTTLGLEEWSHQQLARGKWQI
jgi:hypothetical protein